MFTLRIGDPDALDDPEPQDNIPLGGKPDVWRAFKTLTGMYVKRYGILNEGQPYPDLLILPIYHMANVEFTPDEFRQIQAQAREFLEQERPTDDLVLDVLNTLAHAPLPLWSADRKDANTRGEGSRAATLIISPWALRGWGDDTKHFEHTYFMYCRRCGRVKVGASKDPKGRLRAVQPAHQTKCQRVFPGPTSWRLRLLATFSGNDQVRFRRRKFPGLYTRREWLPYVPSVKRFLSRAIEAGRADPGRGKLPLVPDWTLLRECQVFKQRRRRERGLLARILRVASTGAFGRSVGWHERVGRSYQKFLARRRPQRRGDVMP
jgi:hypothetical protein